MQTVLCFGHRNPDTDTICSAIAYAYLKKALGQPVEAVRLGEVNNETNFALNHFGVAAPRLITTAAPEASEVILVDHNERQQSVSDLDQVKVIEVIDHHRIANFETGHPLYFRVEPVGCTATILLKLFKEHGIDVPRDIAGLMVSAIVSDTLLLKSPTCMDQDVAAIHELAGMADVELHTYGLAMLKAGADIGDKTTAQLIAIDSKEFQMGDYKVEIAQVNAIDPQDVLSRQAEIEAALTDVIAAKQLDLFLFIVTDILQNDSVALALGQAADAVERAFGVSLVDHKSILKGVVSRKQQVVPVLTEALASGPKL
ncbi:MAG: manganese-dependent inorganic pyrophosphatase [Firmicutes bacterium]|nr:manganese-dependent inorganic pyrophosphatase [Bacillota bacterium]